MHRRLAGSIKATTASAAAHYVGTTLTERVERAGEILGTTQASELAQALTLLSPETYAVRHRLLAGIRILPTGRLLVDDTDIFPDLVAHWSSVGSSLAEAE